MITAFDLTAVLSIGFIIMGSCVGMGVYLFTQSRLSE